MEYETTNISDLPTNPQTAVNNLPVLTNNMPTNEIVNSQSYNQVMNECMTEVNQHDNNPSLQIPSQDIPNNPVSVTNDPNVRANYVPPKGPDTIGNVKKVRFQEPPKELETELIIAVLASILFLLCHLPYFKSSFIKILTKLAPSLVKSDGNLKLIGNILYTVLFGATLYGTIKTIDYSSLQLAF